LSLPSVACATEQAATNDSTSYMTKAVSRARIVPRVMLRECVGGE
jgi:hypothetical protein